MSLLLVCEFPNKIITYVHKMQVQIATCHIIVSVCATVIFQVDMKVTV